MKKAAVYLHNKLAGEFTEEVKGKKYIFCYDTDYVGPPISLAMPVETKQFVYNSFPPFFDGLLPEGTQLEGLLKIKKIDRNDLFSQLMAVGNDLVGAVTVEVRSE